jgi:acyl carrier protein
VEIIDDVRAIVAKALKIPIERLTSATRLEELGAESLDVIEIVFGLEQKFDISIPFMADEGARAKTAKVDQVEFATIGDLANVVKKLIEAKASR